MRASPRERAASALGSAVLVAGLGWALTVGLGVSLPGTMEETLAAFDVAPLPPPHEEQVVPPKQRSKRPEGRAAPPNIRSQATRVVAPVPVVPVLVPPTINVAPVAHIGSDPTAGAADRPGPGTGAGGEGNGFGGGGSGDGDGGGADEAETPPRWRRGTLGNWVLPEALRDRNGLYSVEVRFFVEPDGRVTECRAARPSGYPELDGNACQGFERRVRYHPARDAAGRPVRSIVVSTQEWLVEGEPDPPRTR